MNKIDLSERDICTKFITPALGKAGRDEIRQIREKVNFTKGHIIVRGKLVTQGVAPPKTSSDNLVLAETVYGWKQVNSRYAV